MARFAVALLIGGLAVCSAMGASPDPNELVIPERETLKARALVRQLGSEDYREREQAHAALSKMGRLAAPVLREAAVSDPVPEIRFRTSRLLPKASVHELTARLDTFLADKDEKYDHGLPAWKQFRKLIGRDERARSFFVEMMKSADNRKLLRDVGLDPTAASRAISDRQTMLVHRMASSEQLDLSEIAGLLFAMSLVPDKLNLSGAALLNQQASQTTLTPLKPSQQGLLHRACDGREWDPYKGVDWKYATAHSEAFRRLVKLWIESLDNPLTLSEALKALGRDPPSYIQSVPLLQRIITTAGVDGDLKVHAIRSLIRERRGVEDAFFKGVLSDDSLAWTMRWGNDPQTYAIRVQDVALALFLVQSEQRLTDYGFVFSQGVGEPTLHDLGQATHHAFATAEARTAAFVKFGFWQLKQSFKEPVKPPLK